MSDTETEERDQSRMQMNAQEAETTDPDDVETSVDDEDVDERIDGVLTIRKAVESTADDLIGRKFDGVSELSPTDEGWRAVVEVVERAAVPDTQDIVGRYEIALEEDGTVSGYTRLDRYRRGDTVAFE